MKVELENISAGYGGKQVLAGVSLTVQSGEIVSLVGANGSGKSTLLKTIGRLLRPQSGCVYLDGKALCRMDSTALAREMAILPQNHHSPEAMTVEELVALGRFPHRRGIARRAEDAEAVEEALLLADLGLLRHRSLATLSGGERQRAWLALTLAQRPKVLLLDEPTTFLDLSHQLELMELIVGLNRRTGLTVIMVLHDLNLAARCSHRLAAVRNGGIHCSGRPAEVLTEAMLREVFGIAAHVFFAPDGIPYCLPTASCRTQDV